MLKNIFHLGKKYRIFNFSTIKNDIYTISLIARPNVGKSTLFNKLASHKYAIVDAKAGTTRDRKEVISTFLLIKKGSILGYPIRFVDTAGWDFVEDEIEPEIALQMKNQALIALHDSNLALFIVDTKEGITFADIELRKHLNEHSKKNKQFKLPPFLLLANKAENFYEGEILEEYMKLKLGEPIFLSAEFGDGIVNLE